MHKEDSDGKFFPIYRNWKKPIYIVKSHHHSLLGWAKLRRKCQKPSTLITLDHHTDTHFAFLQYSSKKYPNDNDDAKRKCFVNKLIQVLDYHDDDCIKPHYDQAIETIFLQDKMDIIEEMKPDIIKNCVIDKNFILDIDLDYFHTIDSINPKNTNLFYKLIRQCSIITIAMEDDYVELVRLEEKIDSKFLLDKLLNHISKVLYREK